MKAIFLLLLSVCFTVAFSQEKEWGIEYRQKIGFLAAHHATMEHLPQQHIFAGELSFYFHGNGEKNWQIKSNYPYYGVTLYGGNAGNKELLGYYVGAYGFIDFPLIKKKHFEFLSHCGTGLGFTNKVFNQETNPKNDAISSHLNALVSLGLKTHFLFGRNRIALALDMTHFSNGSSIMPNLGINLPFLSLGYAYTIHQAIPLENSIKPDHLLFKKWLFGATFIASQKEVFPTGGKKYGVYALSAHARWFARPKVGFEAALDIISKQSILRYKPELSKTQWDILQVGVFAGYLIPLDRFHFVVGMGAYIKDKYNPDGLFYHRVGMRYYFDNGLNAQLVLKSNWAKADYIEWGVGYTFNYKQK